jgi:hypothetical protein
LATDEAVLARLDDLIGRADGLRNDNDQRTYYALMAQAQVAVAAVVGSDSDYYRLLNGKAVTQPYRYSTAAGIIAECLTNLRSDVANGYLRRQSDLIGAEVFGDFLDMAGHLLEHEGYHHAAASLIGAVLEDGLRRIARAVGVEVNPGDDIAVLNNRLVSKDVYNNLVRKQVDLWSAVRNKADHAEWDQYTVDQVKDMYTGVTRFMAERLA